MTSTPHAHIQRDGFRLRGVELARIDAFSDVVFGFALTLLVVSLEVPKTFNELQQSLRSFVPFAICFLFLMMVWHAHYKFFQRFGTHDFSTIVINAILLFVVLFYVYPLKFLFTFVTTVFSGGSTDSIQTYRQLQELMILFGVGFAAIYLLIGALYWNAWRQRLQLDLNPVERILAIGYLVESIGIGLIGLLSCLVARLLPETLAGLAGWTFLLIAVFRPLLSRVTRRRIARQEALPPPSIHPLDSPEPVELLDLHIDGSE